ncbi:MAG: hypothetical protein JKY87_00260 [Mariprofundus sp.]|nr:hypothetical protein [Mariprofundus sp.]
MELFLLIKENSDVIGLLLAMIVLPMLQGIRKSHKAASDHDTFLMQSIATSTKHIEQLRIEMMASQRRHERMEDAVLFLADDKKVKEVISILRGHQQSDDAHGAIA